MLVLISFAVSLNKLKKKLYNFLVNFDYNCVIPVTIFLYYEYRAAYVSY